MRKLGFGMWNFGFRNVSVIRKFEFRNSNFEIPRPVKGREGFTLIEVVIVIVLIGVLATVLIQPFHQGVQSFIAVETRGDLTAEARQATTRMVREIRNVDKKANKNAPTMSNANATSISFNDVLRNSITFSLSGSTVQRNTNTLADKVSSLQFRYFDGSNAELTSLPLSGPNREKVRKIRVVLTMQEGGQTVTVTGEALLRNFRGL